MALKRKLTKEEFAKLKKDVQEEYTADGEGYILDLDGYEDPEELRRARDREKQTAKDLRKQLKEANEKIEDYEGDDPARTPPKVLREKEADLAKLEKVWKDKHEKVVGDLTKKDTSLRSVIQNSMIGEASKTLAHKISTVPTMMADTLAKRMRVTFDENDVPKLEIIDREGKPSLTLEQLEKEVVANKDYAAIIIGSKGSGGGAPRNAPDPKLGGASASATQPALSNMSPKDLVASLTHLRPDG